MTLTGDLLDNRYAPKRILGEGAMGQVLLVEDTLTQQPLALKIISPASGERDKSVLQLQQEFRLMTRLKHPNCCAVTSYGLLAEGAPYFTMEVVPGQGLDELEGLDEERFVALFSQLLLALGYIHQLGFVHRDLKPANVRVKPDGTIKLMDFGLMEHAGRSGGAIVGTVPYLSPEVIKRGAVDGRADLYSLGALAYELLTGQVPFVRPTPVEVLRAHMGETPVAPSSLRPGLSRRLESIVMRLLAKDPVERFQTAYDVLEALGHAVPAGIGGTLLSASLVGREEALGVLAAGLTQVGSGAAARPLLVWGAEGTGKSRLLEELRFQAELANVPFVMGKAYESGNFPYRHFVWILKSLMPVMRQHVPAVLDQLAPVLVKLLPELGVAPAPEMEASQEKLRLQAAVTEAMLALAGQVGYVVALENWQWAEALSVELLAHLLRNVGDAPIWVIASSRQAHTGAQDGLTEVARLPLAPLGGDEVSRMVGSMLGVSEVDAGFVRQVAALTEGNPLFVERLLEHLVKAGRLHKAAGRWQTGITLSLADLPGGLAGLLAENLGRLSVAAAKVAEAGAVLGPVFELPVLRRVADQGDAALFDALDELTTLAILSGDNGTYHFTQTTYQAYFYGRVEPADRLARHAAAIGALEAQLGETPLREAPLELVSALARHALIAGATEKAIAYALEAGLRSARLFANADAEELLSAGLRQIQVGGGDRYRLIKLRYLHALGDTRRVAGNWPGARAALEDASALATEFGDAASLGRILASLAKVLQVLKQLGEALDAADRGEAASLRVGAGGEAARARLTAARIRLYQGKAAEALADAEQALVLAQDAHDEIQQASALGLLGFLHANAGRSAEGFRALHASIALNEALGDRMGLHTALDYVANAEILRGEWQAASRTLERKNALCQAIGLAGELAYGLVNQALVALEIGHYAESARLATEALALSVRQEDGIAQSFSRLIAGCAEARLGHMAKGLSLAEAAERQAVELDNQYLLTEILPHRVALAVYWGDASGARGHLTRLQALGADGGAAGEAMAGEVLLLEGQAAEAARAFERARELAATSETHGTRLRALVGLARAQVVQEAWEAAETTATDAVALADTLGVLAPKAEALGLLGEVLLAFGRSEAAATFAAMQAAAAACGDGALTAQALFGQAASSPYGPEAAQRAQAAKQTLESFAAALPADARAAFLSVRERQRVLAGNHIAMSLPRVKKRDTGPLPPQGMWKMF